MVRPFLLGVCFYLIGAFLLEATLNFIPNGDSFWLSKGEALLEATLEMIGTILVLLGLFRQHRGMRWQEL